MAPLGAEAGDGFLVIQGVGAGPSKSWARAEGWWWEV